jgi:hypothetical protein
MKTDRKPILREGRDRFGTLGTKMYELGKIPYLLL